MKFAKLDTLDDELIYKRVKIRVGSSKSLYTPIKATNFLNPVSPINEMYRQFNTDRLDEIIKNESKERKVNSEISKLKTNEFNFFYVTYTGREKPNKNQLEALSDIQYSHSDVVIPPLFSNIVRDLKEDKLLNDFLDLTNQSLEISETLNNKPLMGIIPALMPRQFLKPIIKNYFNRGINSFAIDFNGRSIDTNISWARNLMRLIAEYDLSEQSFLYGLNCNAGRFIKKSDRILAKDFISMGCGIDILGINHIAPRMSSADWRNLKNQRKESLFRVFDSKGYAYIKTGESELRNKISGKIGDEIKKFNLASQYNESVILQQKLGENNTIEPYIQNKDMITPDLIKNMKILRKEAFDHLNYEKIDKWFD